MMNDISSPEARPLAIARPTSVRYQVLAAACTLALIAYIHRVGFAPAGTYIKTDLGLSDQEWSVVMSAFLVAYALFEVPWGLWGDRLGGRHLLTVMALGWSGLTAAVGLVVLVPESTWLGVSLPLLFLLLLRFLFGAFQAGAFPAFSRVMTDWMPVQERATAQGCIWMFSRIGGAVAPFIMVGIIQSSGNWEMSFVLVSILGVVWCAVFWPWFRNRPEQMKRVNAAECDLIKAGRSTTHLGHISWFRLFRCRSVWFLCLMYCCGAFSANFFITLLPSYLRDHRGLDAEEMKWLTSLPLAFGVLACLLGGVVSDRIIRKTGNRKWGRRITGMIGLAGAGLALLATNWVQDTWLLAALLSATFFCNDLAIGPAWASCADIGERYAGTLGGTMNMIGNLGGAIGTLIAGYLFGKVFDLTLGGATYAILGNELVFWVFACSFWLGSLCWLGVDVTKPLTATAPQAKKRCQEHS